MAAAESRVGHAKRARARRLRAHEVLPAAAVRADRRRSWQKHSQRAKGIRSVEAGVACETRCGTAQKSSVPSVIASLDAGSSLIGGASLSSVTASTAIASSSCLTSASGGAFSPVAMASCASTSSFMADAPPLKAALDALCSQAAESSTEPTLLKGSS